MNDIHGQLVFSTVICFTDINSVQKSKRVTLASIPCKHSECEAVKESFIEMNREHMHRRMINAEFKYQEFI